MVFSKGERPEEIETLRLFPPWSIAECCPCSFWGGGTEKPAKCKKRKVKVRKTENKEMKEELLSTTNNTERRDTAAALKKKGGKS